MTVNRLLHKMGCDNSPVKDGTGLTLLLRLGICGHHAKAEGKRTRPSWRDVRDNCSASAAHVLPHAFSKTPICNPSVEGYEMRSWQEYKLAALRDDF